MKKYIAVALLLTGCVGNPKLYTCFNVENNNNPIYKQGDVFCMSDMDYHRIQNRSYEKDLSAVMSHSQKDPVIMFAEYVTLDATNARCSFANNDGSKDYFKYESGGKVDHDKRAYICPNGTLDVMTNHVLDILEQSEKEQKKDNIKSLEKKLGRKLCSYDDDRSFLFRSDLEQNCAFQLGWFFNIMNQTGNGTLITVHPSYQRNLGDGIYFISTNVTDSKLVDDQRVEDGYFEVAGTYRYTAVSGAKKTVSKLKRLSKSDLIEQPE